MTSFYRFSVHAVNYINLRVFCSHNAMPFYIIQNHALNVRLYDTDYYFTAYTHTHRVIDPVLMCCLIMRRSVLVVCSSKT